MKVRGIASAVIAVALFTGLGGCSSMGTVTSPYDQLGGMDGVRSLSDAFVNNMASNPSTSGMLGNTNLGALKSRMSDQLCALAGGSCKAPLTGTPIADAGVTKLVGPQVGGIVAGLL